MPTDRVTPPGRKWGDVRRRDNQSRARFDGTYGDAYHAQLYTLPSESSGAPSPSTPSQTHKEGRRATWNALSGSVWQTRPSPEVLATMRAERAQRKSDRARSEAARSARMEQIRRLVAEGEQRAERQRLKHQ